MLSSSVAMILQSSSELAEPIRVSGTTLPVRALLVTRFLRAQSHLQKTKGPWVILCSSDDEASEFCADLEIIASILYSESIQVRQFPTWEQSPYSPITPSLKSRLTRLAVLSSLIKKVPPDVIVTSLAAACQASMPPAFFHQNLLLLKTDETHLSREAFIYHLLQSGYLRVDPVDDPGTFAIRGEIVDVFPPDRPRPLRIELYGDLVEKIREFDVASQRTLSQENEKIQKVILPPAKEVLLNSSTSVLLRERIKARSDDLGIPRINRDPILSSIREGHYPEYSDIWAPFAYPESSHLWDYLPAQSPLIWNDELTCRQEWEKFRNEQKVRAEEATRIGRIAPAPENLYPWQPTLEKQILQNTQLFLDRIDLTDAKENLNPTLSNRHRVIVQTLREFIHGARHSLKELEPHLRLWIQEGYKIFALASTQSQLERIRFLLEQRNITDSQVNLRLGAISEGFCLPTEGLIFLTEEEILGSKHKRKQRRASNSESGSAAKNWSGLQALSDLMAGDALVHIDHGIGRYEGLVRLDLMGAPMDFLRIEYANKDKLYLPVYRLNVIQKYVGAGETLSLNRLGSQQFAKSKEKVREGVKNLAFDLVQLYAERKIRSGPTFSPRDAAFREFESQFQFDETPDQLKAIDAILSDMESGRVMDRLVCGDVGYGKTEVAIRAAFRAVSDGKQVAVLVPTTILAQQHEQNFKNRLKNYPLLIESVSRFKTLKEQKIILEAVAKGRIDIIIGTHRLLSNDVRFQDLGLVVVDEEHRFGVEHKERLKTLKINAHVLTLTATPIPRTLHMALSGLRDISLINTPPVDRLPIRTYVATYDESIIQRAIETELARGGQVFFLHNRVSSIHKIAARIRQLVPTSRVEVAHGQSSEHELEETMLAFYKGKFNVLVCTTIIESGLDIPTANTILINRADTLGLAQLYQIRGRVGRGQQRAYAYLLIPPETSLSEDAKKRLEIIQRFVELGSGFSIASHDLEIRGGGDLLGPQQSGNIAAVGFDLYTKLLEEAIHEIQGKPAHSESSSREPEIKAPFPSYLSEEYVPDVHQRLSLYRRFSAAAQDCEVNLMEEELRDRFGDLPLEAQNLLWLIRLKVLLKKMGMDALTVGPEKIALLPGPQSKLDPIRAIALISAHPNQYQLTPDSKFVAKIPTGSLRDLFFALETLFGRLVVQ